MNQFLGLQDFEAAARRFLPRFMFGYVSGGVETDASLRSNRAAFEALAFIPKPLVDVSGRTQAVSLFGQTYASPFGIAPMGVAAAAAYLGDLVMARAAAAANIPMVLSGAALTSLEAVIQENPGAWFQAYVRGDNDEILLLVERVARAGYRTLCLTVDVPVMGNRENNLRNGFTTPLRPSPRLAWDCITHPRWLGGVLGRTLALHGMPYFENSGPRIPLFSRHAERFKGGREGLTWRHVELIRREWKGNLVIKGILDKDATRIARECGADGIIVSNHGGRQLDGAVAPLRVLQGIVAQAHGMVIMLDGGIRRGTDVLKALALGARFVFLGRPFLYAAAIAGETGVTRAVSLLQEEIHRNMALLGITHLDEMRARLLENADCIDRSSG